MQIPEELSAEWLLEHTNWKGYVCEIAAKLNTKQVNTLYDLCYHPEQRVSFRAAWVLEEVAYHRPDLFITVAPTFLRQLQTQKNLSCQRHFTKILMGMSGPNAARVYTDLLADSDTEHLVEVIFEWLLDERTPVAVQVNCLDILFHFSEEFDWIKEELQAQVELRMHQGSPAMDARGKKILQKLRSSSARARRSR